MKNVLLAGACALAMCAQANAADLGGNCCADLEERVAELEATTARKGNRRVSLEVSGHVNEAIMFWDGPDGTDLSDYRIVNNTDSQSRFRFRGSAQLRPGWSAGFLLEFGMGFDNSGSPQVRHQALYIRSESYGTVWLGQTSEATDGIMELAVAGRYTGATMGSLGPMDAFIRDETGLVITNPFDGGRKGVLRYVSPEFAGFNFSASLSEGEDWDVALRYANEFNSIRIAAGIGYRHESVSTLNESGDRDFWGGSISAMHTPTGLFVDAQYGVSDGVQQIGFDLPVPLTGTIQLGIPDTELKLWGVRGGIARNFTSRGATTFWVSYNDLDIEGIDINPTMWRLGVAQDIDAAAMTLYAWYGHVDLGIDDVDFDDQASMFLAGAMIRF